MLIRAIVISVLLHVVILVSPNYLGELARTAPDGDGVSALSVVIASQRGIDSLDPGIRKAAMIKARAAVRAPDAPPKSTAENFNFGPFFRSTVEPAVSGEARSDRSLEVTPIDVPVASVEEIGRYRLNVARSARQFKVYPPLAREKGWEGVVQVSVSMPTGQGTPMVSLVNSSGYELLDSQALEMVTQAVNLAVLPEGMRGRRMAISLPVEYRLGD
ncbi:energy transducer TonB [Ferribacterium limneticum]|uniref:energy transducer TonB n=1 Tax=Ferribacterium limneticum TaxID=76259 RepID=UPI001CFA63F3|nr:energy transducer TonB [Ferribacterium limneticum]UCV19717.1 TonB family protein [Ferribacterium limneticum]